jgi:hypothetical protein
MDEGLGFLCFPQPFLYLVRARDCYLYPTMDRLSLKPGARPEGLGI